MCHFLMDLPLQCLEVHGCQDSITAETLRADTSTRVSPRIGGGGVTRRQKRIVDMSFVSERVTIMSLACRRGNKPPHPLFIWVTN